jgi:serine/threonine protein kinase
MSNGSVEDVLDNGLIFGEMMVMSWLIRALKGLEFLHAKQCSHSDIKPANFLLDEKWQLYLGDLGLLKQKSPRPMIRQRGTPEYSAPELSQQMPFDVPMDIWSLGIAFCQILNGDLDWLHNSEHLTTQQRYDVTHAAIEKIQRKGKIGIHSLNFIVSQNLRDIITKKMVVVDIANRATATELLNDPRINNYFQHCGLARVHPASAAPRETPLHDSFQLEAALTVSKAAVLRV